MARYDFRIHNHPLGYQPTWNVLRDDRDTSAEVQGRAGEFFKGNATAGQFAVRAVDLDFTNGTDQPVLGVAAADSTETAAADGKVEIFVNIPGTVYEGTALSDAAIDTQAEIDALAGEYHVLDVAATTVDARMRIDTAAGSGANNVLYLTGGDPGRVVLWFMIRTDAVAYGRSSV